MPHCNASRFDLSSIELAWMDLAEIQQLGPPRHAWIWILRHGPLFHPRLDSQGYFSSLPSPAGSSARRALPLSLLDSAQWGFPQLMGRSFRPDSCNHLVDMFEDIQRAKMTGAPSSSAWDRVEVHNAHQELRIQAQLCPRRRSWGSLSSLPSLAKSSARCARPTFGSPGFSSMVPRYAASCF